MASHDKTIARWMGSLRFCEAWSLANASRDGVGNDPTYNAKSCFETFPFLTARTPTDTAPHRTEALEGDALIPAELPPGVRAHAAANARGAKRLTSLRDAWLNPPEWTERVPEVVPLGMGPLPEPDRRHHRGGDRPTRPAGPTRRLEAELKRFPVP